ncbi:hypothetical protein F2Q70_00020247 [Brassica cretica]|uniref:Phosphofructokinase domain-containing protein n=1 Tax=Brassica cretica TaxID=69181 RepID=A0A8S9GMW1_BRACR|nr:hypothetical protein F2Q70_00020247 [Brassica cretica]
MFIYARTSNVDTVPHMESRFFTWKVITTEQVNAALKACTDLKLDGLVIIGGVTSNTDAAHLAEFFSEAKCSTKVVGVPVTTNGDLKNQFVEANVGFDTICKVKLNFNPLVNSQLISNACTDALSAEKYYYFIRLMGRKHSHVALECTLQSHPNMVILGEEVAASKLTIFDISKQICDAVQARAGQDKNHGVILIPEGIIESIPEVYALLKTDLRGVRASSGSQIGEDSEALIFIDVDSGGYSGNEESFFFNISDPSRLHYLTLEAQAYSHNRPTNGRSLLGKVSLPGTSFVPHSDAIVLHFPMEKRGIFSRVRAELGLKVYITDEASLKSYAAALIQIT